ncbi:MAG: hypothetical protein IJ097_00835 [Bacilli bacterium]|nr:hypothetical protein [Bacilli bacterium]
MKNEKQKNIVLAVLLVAVVTLTIAYALLSATLTINAQATVKGANWDVHFQEKSDQSAICVASSKTGAATTTAEVKTQPTVSNTSFTGLAADLKLPGDKVVCTWQVTNAGSIDAKLATYTAPALTYAGDSADVTKVTGKINTTLTVDGATPANGDVLPATTGNTKDVVLTIEFDPNATELPSQDVTVTVASETFVYEQN